MLSRVASTFIFALLAIVALLGVISPVSAIPTPDRDDGDDGYNNCNTGPVNCCNSVQAGDSADASVLLALLGVVLQDVSVPVGLICDPISVIGIGGNSCSTQPVCCDDNSFNGIIAIGCTPININL